MEWKPTEQLVLDVLCPGNQLLTDRRNRPSVMVRIPALTYRQLGLGELDQTHPAFWVNGREVQALYLSKYPNILDEGLAYSLPGQAPAVNLTFDEAAHACAEKGHGWHLMTRTEWALLAQWCLCRGVLPRGNNHYGKDIHEHSFQAMPAAWKGGRTTSVQTGTGPLTWSHNGEPSGIWDLNGNVGEWVSGLRLVYGELQILPNNDGADICNSQAVDSLMWRTIHAATGALIPPAGDGRTAHSLKLDYRDGIWTWCAELRQERTDRYRSCPFAQVSCDPTVSEAARQLLLGLCLYQRQKDPSLFGDTCFYADNGAEEIFFGCGGHYGHGNEAGIFCIHATTKRTATSPSRGFRCAYAEF